MNDDLISRQEALNIRFSDAINEDGVLYVPLRDFTDGLKALSSARPDINEWCTDCKEYDQEQHCCHRWSKVIRETIEDFKKEYVGEWIPCSERLPEKSGRYLVTNTRLGAFEVTWNIFYNGKGEAPEGWLYEDGTIAWMPLPEPYKGEE